jgi:WD40 repeat protein
VNSARRVLTGGRRGDSPPYRTRDPAKVWDVSTGAELFTLSGQAGVINTVYSPDGARVATAATDGSVKVWDAASGRELLTLDLSGAGALRAAFSPDGSRLAVASQNTTTGIYLLRFDDVVDLAQRRVTRTLTADECQQFLHVDSCQSAQAHFANSRSGY